MIEEENQNLTTEQVQSVIDHYCLQLKVKPIVISAYLKEKGTALEIKELKMQPNLIKALALTLPVRINIKILFQFLRNIQRLDMGDISLED